MIRVDEASSGRPESRYSLGLYAVTLLLATLTAALGVNTVFRDLPEWVTWTIPAVLGVLLGFVFAARPAIADSIRTLSHGEAMAWWLLSAALFACVSVIFGKWSPLLGLVALQLPAMLTLVTERGYARYYVLCGSTLALALSQLRVPEPMACSILGIFLLLMVLTMAYENFFFGLENAPAGAQLGISAWLPFRAALVRFSIAAVLTAPLAWLTPLDTFKMPTRSSSDEAVRPLMSGNIDTSFTLLETFIYTMVLILMLLALGALFRWMRNRRRRRSDELGLESIGVPVGEFRPLQEVEEPPPPDPTTPVGKVVFWYNRFSESAGLRGRARRRSETPAQFRQALLEECTLPPQPVDTITARFETARYAPGEVTDQEAHEFQLIVEETITRMSASAAPTPLPE